MTSVDLATHAVFVHAKHGMLVS